MGLSAALCVRAEPAGSVSASNAMLLADLGRFIVHGTTHVRRQPTSAWMTMGSEELHLMPPHDGDSSKIAR
jgi:hypothetical protein